MITQFKLINTFAGVLLPGLADVIGIFLLKQYIQTMPRELEEAARMDGASEWKTFTRVIVPLAAPAMAVTAIFAFQRYWNAFLVLRTQPLRLQVGLRTSQQRVSTATACSCPARASVDPDDPLFLCVQRYFMQGCAWRRRVVDRFNVGRRQRKGKRRAAKGFCPFFFASRPLR
jgi:multiple sugar transport system permease protein